MKSVINKIICLICFAASMLMYNTANAGGPEGDIRTLAPEVKMELKKSFEEEDYRYHCGNLSIDECLQRNIIVYLCANQHLLARWDYPKAREVDVVICIMTIKGNHRIQRFIYDMSFCKRYVIRK